MPGTTADCQVRGTYCSQTFQIAKPVIHLYWQEIMDRPNVYKSCDLCCHIILGVEMNNFTLAVHKIVPI